MNSKTEEDKHNICKPSIAVQRWKILGNALKNNKVQKPTSISVRAFTNFEIFKLIKVDSNWTKYSYTTEKNHYEADICDKENTCNARELLGFNNTGNVCIWPSEEILAKYCMNNADMFRGKSICELGGGMSCLAGIMVAQFSDYILVTDGNEGSIENVRKIIDRNSKTCQRDNIEASVLRWDQVETYPDRKFNFIISADCLFFDKYRASLLKCIRQLLTPGGICIIFSPRRGHTFDEFVEMAKNEHFTVTVSDDYDTKITEFDQRLKLQDQRLYNSDLNFPLLIKLTFNQ